MAQAFRSKFSSGIHRLFTFGASRAALALCICDAILNETVNVLRVFPRTVRCLFTDVCVPVGLSQGRQQGGISGTPTSCCLPTEPEENRLMSPVQTLEILK